MIRFSSLGSGSAGNGLLVETGAARVLVDCGFGLAEAHSRLARRGVQPTSITAIMVTHEHGDHAGGALRLAKRHRIPLWTSYGTWQALAPRGEGVDVRYLSCGESFALVDLAITPFTVPHDAREPLQFVFSDGHRRLGLLTDVGTVTPHVRRNLSGCDGLVLECNHDSGMLERSRYPASLKRRISGTLGHLENGAAAALLREIDTSRLRCLVAAHLSQENNRADLAAGALASAVGWPLGRIVVATQEDGFDWQALE